MFAINQDNTTLLIIDVQKTTARLINNDIYKTKLQNMVKMAEAARVLNLPYFITQHYTKGFGDTVEEITNILGNKHYEKMTYSACKAKDFQLSALINTPNVLVMGAETHVCILQTVLDLLGLNYKVYVIADAVMSRTKDNWKIALKYMNDAGAIITSTETTIFQLMESSEHQYFKELIRIMK